MFNNLHNPPEKSHICTEIAQFAKKTLPLQREKHSNLTMPKRHLYISLLLLICTACQKHYTPKPYGYFRIDLPEHHYTPYRQTGYPYSFEQNSIAQVKPVSREGEKYWIDITYPQYNAIVHCSYKPIRHNLRALTDDAVEFVFSHVTKATAIPERAYNNPEANVSAVVFDLEGNTATPMQFFLTDSTRHFFRAALYFNNIPNQDSLAPVAAYIKEDMEMLIETFRWQ